MDLVFVQNGSQSHLERRDRTVDSTPREVKSEMYAFTYSVPATTNESSETQPVEESNATPAEVPPEDATSVDTKPQVFILRVLKNLDLSKLRTFGLLGWTAIAAAGAVAVVLESGPGLGIQLGTLTGVWFAVSVAIWFLPAKLGPAL